MYEPNGVLYGLKPGGDLLWYRHRSRRSPTAVEGPRVVRASMSAGAVFAGEDGILYSVPAGEPRVVPLTWWRHVGRGDGTDDWEGPHVAQASWGPFRSAFTAPGGIIYGVRPDGDLVWHRHLGRDTGAADWEGPQKVGTGWDDFSHVFSGLDGRIYGVVGPQSWVERNRDVQVEPINDLDKVAAGLPVADIDAHPPAANKAPKHRKRADHFDSGDVLMYRHLGQQDGSFAWDGPVKVGSGWDRFKHVFSGGDDIVYTVGPKADTWAGRHLEDQVVPIPGPPPVFDHALNEPAEPKPAEPPHADDLLWLCHSGAGSGSPDWAGPEPVGQGWDSFTSLTCGGPELRDWAAAKIFDYWLDNTAISTIGTAASPPVVVRDTYRQEFSFGTITQPLVGDATLSNRHLVTISIVGIKMFASDDPSGEDEPHIVTTAYAIDKLEGAKAETTRSAYLGEQQSGAVFGQDYQVANGMFVPGDGSIHVNIVLWDDEAVGLPDEVVPAIREKVKDGITSGLPIVAGAVGSAFGPAGTAAGGFIGAGLAFMLASTGISEGIGTAIGKLVVSAFGPDLIDQKGFSITTDYLTHLRDDPGSMERTSPSINGLSYNFPEGPEDDSWLFERGHGTYRVFMRVALTKTE